MFYTVIFILLFIASLGRLTKPTTIGSYYIAIIFLFFWLIAGLSYETGVDWLAYKFMYTNCYSLNDAFKFGSFYSTPGIVLEPGYSFLCSLAKTFHFNFWFFKFTISLFTSIFFFKALVRYTTNYYLVLLLYFGFIYLTLNMSGIRQALSLSIFFYSLKYIINKDLKSYILLILLASTIHISSIILLLFYFVLNKKLSSISIYICITVGIFFQVLKISLIRSLFIALANFFNNPFIVKFLLYSSKETVKSNSLSISFLITIIVFILIVLKRKKIGELNSHSNIFINLYFFYVCLYSFLWDINDVKVRLGWYFAIGLIILIPELVMIYTKTINRIALFLLATSMAFYASNFIFLERKNGITYNPYQSYLTHELFDIQSTGERRLYEFSKNIEK